MNITDFSMHADFEGHANMARMQELPADLASFVFAHPVRRLMEVIAQEVLDQHYADIPLKEIMSETKIRRIAWARQHIWTAILEERHDLTICEVGRKFRRNHQTIIYGMQQHQERMKRAAA